MTAVIVIPVFNEAATVGRVVKAARLHGPVLVVDDGSRDDSGGVAARAGAKVLRHVRRLGKAQALRTGITAARGCSGHRLPGPCWRRKSSPCRTAAA